jgi:hypothetical protein
LEKILVTCWISLALLGLTALGCSSPQSGVDSYFGSSDVTKSSDQTTEIAPDIPTVVEPPAGCLTFSGGPLHFLPTPVDAENSLSLTLTSCDFDGNRIVAATILPADSPFALEDPSGAWDPESEEWVVPAWQQKQLQVVFRPTEASPIVNGTVEPFTATLRLEYRFEKGRDDALESGEVLLSGRAVQSDCITAIVTTTRQVASPLAVRLDGLTSISPTGPIAGYEWTVAGPVGAIQAFHPSSSTATTVFATDTAGPYEFTLDVTDESGTPQCFTAPVKVELDGVKFDPAPPASTMGLVVLLHWRTPGDWHYEDGESVSNVDLHLVHDWAGGPDLDNDGQPDGWFDTPYDCWAGNPGPHWGINEPGSTDDPDFFGDEVPQGPEQIFLATPEQLPYRVGVHYRDDFGLGPVFARVIVYFHGEVVMESPEVLLWELDLWEVATAEWPDQTVTPVITDNGDSKILNDYSNPYEQ